MWWPRGCQWVKEKNKEEGKGRRKRDGYRVESEAGLKQKVCSIFVYAMEPTNWQCNSPLHLFDGHSRKWELCILGLNCVEWLQAGQRGRHFPEC